MRKSIENQLDTMDSELKLLLRDLKKFSDKDLNWQPRPGKWSVLQVMQHLMLAEMFSHQYVEKKLSFDPKLKKAGLPSALRLLLLRFYLGLPVRFKAPKGVSTVHLQEKAAFWDLVKQWNHQRDSLRSYLAGLPDDKFDKSIYKHPIVGRLSLQGMLTFHRVHFRRHRKQIRRILVHFRY